MNSPENLHSEALDTLLSVQAGLAEIIELLNTRADLLTGGEEPDSLTEMRALFNTVKGIRSLVEVQTYQANASS
jgi:hypothetical protein